MRRVRKLGRKNSVVVRLDTSHGKGSHATLYYGDKRTTIPDRRKELGRGLIRSMCRDLVD